MGLEDLNLVMTGVHAPITIERLSLAKRFRRMVISRFPMAYGAEGIDSIELSQLDQRDRGVNMRIDFDQTHAPLPPAYVRSSQYVGPTAKVWRVGLSLRAPALMAIQFEPHNGVLTPVIHMDQELRAWSEELAAALHVRAMDGYSLWSLQVDVEPFEADRLMPTDDPGIPTAYVWLFGE